VGVKNTADAGLIFLYCRIEVEKEGRRIVVGICVVQDNGGGI
jgi:hypothetical protein